MIERTVLELPITDAGCGTIRIVASSTRLDAEYEYFSRELETDAIGIIRFKDVRAYRFRGELQSLGFVESSYDTLVEIVDSKWRRELLKIEPKGISGGVGSKKHLAVFFSSNGYLEVIAEDFEGLPPRKGLLRL